MSPLAEVLLARGFSVSGSDLRSSPITDRLRAHGARVYIGHDPAALDSATVVVCSTAIRPDNPELMAAKERGLLILHRSQLLGELLQGTAPIAVAGTHGKSTTAGMLATILVEAGLDPTAIIGAEILNLGGHHRVGAGSHFVLEACESDSSFLNYHGCSQVITSLEADHLDQHRTFDNLVEAFRRFIALGRPDGFLVYSADFPELVSLATDAPGVPVSFGLSEQADYRVTGVMSDIRSCTFELYALGETTRIGLKVPGVHNALNAAAAFAAAVNAGVSPDVAGAALAAFQGVERRFQVLYDAKGILIVDDYAHHPTEIEATLQTARQGWDGRIIAVFQPHLFSRTQLLMDGFAGAFGHADEVILTEIYPAREDPIPGVSSKRLCDAVRRKEPTKTVRFFATKAEVTEYLLPRLSPGDLVLCLGAGDVNEVGEALVRALS